VEGFNFYVLTDATGSFDHALGYFSKEKISYDDYNLACIIIFPPFQKKSFGTLLIEYSYELSSQIPDRIAGTPERPLSELGARTYVSFWASVLVRYFRRIFEAGGDPVDHSTVPPAAEVPLDDSNLLDNQDERPKRISKRRAIGWQGEIPVVKGGPTLRLRGPAPIPTPAEISSESGQSAETNYVVSVAEIARATHLRVEDVAFTLEQTGLGKNRRHDTSPWDSISLEVEIVVTLDLVEEAAKAFRVKEMPLLRYDHLIPL